MRRIITTLITFLTASSHAKATPKAKVSKRDRIPLVMTGQGEYRRLRFG